jgi:hypothetical protein
MRIALLIFALAALAACSKQGADRQAGGVSAGEAQALDQAADKIEARRLPDNALRPPEAPNRSPAGSAAK